ncbi:DUF4238 domain-containing protein [Methylobacterium sp. Leaf86]|uniref:DUF4238 domain-containing protein n=1 Tax=Methylobacterium sp. Leaf86 TaxID=1736242 RepID=UPI0009E865B3|nr:DUF4238 domain-containing protein [Methylobacterium sp. Leaf86]
MPMANGKNAEPKFHHYVSRFILKEFAYRSKGDEHYVKVYDKHTDRLFTPNIKVIMGERLFNTASSDGVDLTIEDTTAKFDDLAAPAIEQVRSELSLRDLSADSRTAIILFIALQVNRGTGARNVAEDIINQFRARLLEEYDEEDLPPQVTQFQDENQKKLFGMGLAVGGVRKIAGVLATRQMIVMAAENNGELLLGDNPVVIHNSRKSDEYHGNLGIACKGIEIYLPISPKLVIALWCPSIYEEMKRALDSSVVSLKKFKSTQLLSINPASQQTRNLIEQLEEKIIDLKHICGAIETESPVIMNKDVVLHQNSLQISYAERYLISKSGRFDPAEKMIGSNPLFRKGSRMKMS